MALSPAKCTVLPKRIHDAARSLLEGLEEMFTISRLDLSRSLMRCLSTTNVIESPNSGVRARTRPQGLS